jgi:hypothetical protein
MAKNRVLNSGQLNVAMEKPLRRMFHRRCLEDGATMHLMITVLARLYIQNLIPPDKIDMMRAKVEVAE